MRQCSVRCTPFELFQQPKNNKIMYRKTKPATGTLRVNKAYEGETIEQKMRRIFQQGAPIQDGDGAPLLYQERKEGVNPMFDIRTDRFDLAIDEVDAAVKTHLTKREERHKPKGTGEQAPTDTEK